jgi:hypothetical protein
MLTRVKTLSFLVAVGLLPALPALAAADGTSAAFMPDAANEDSLLNAFADGTPILDLRYRYEDVHMNNLAKEADANTIRTRAGFDTAWWQDFKAQVQVQNILPIGAEHYNDGTNGLSAYPTIADPRTTAQLYEGNLSWRGVPQTIFTVGRQPYAIDNERWVGISDWRELGQTFDALTVRNNSIRDLDLFYSYAFHDNRTYGPDARFGSGGTAPGEFDMHSDFFHIAYSGIPGVKLIGYSYLADISNYSGNSTSTTGGRFEGKHDLFDDVGGFFNAEYAHQESAFNNPATYGLNYYLVEPGLTDGPFTIKAGYEVMEGNGTNAVQTPFASLHVFNGWAERFLTTPADGLETFNLMTCFTSKDYNEWLGPTTAKFYWYDFNANSASLHYGNEYDFWLGQSFFKHYSVGAQYAEFRGDEEAGMANSRKVVVMLQVKY